MEEDKIAEIFHELIKQLATLDGRLANLEVAVLVLKAYIAQQMNPHNPAEAAALLKEFEAEFLKRDSGTAMREEVNRSVATVELWKKFGKGGHEA